MNNSSFEEILSNYAQRLNFTMKELGEHIGKNAQFINHLKKGVRDKHPAVDPKVFNSLISVLSSKSKNALFDKDKRKIPDIKDIDPKIVIDILFSYFEFEELLDNLIIADNLDYFNNYALEKIYKNETDIWIFSETIAESYDKDIAIDTADFIYDKSFTFKYFVPLGYQNWDLSKEYILSRLTQRTGDEGKALKKLEESLEIIGISGLFLDSIAVVNPLREVLCFSNIGGLVKQDRKYIEIENKRMIKTVSLLQSVLGRIRNSPGEEILIESEKIFAKLLFPVKKI